MKTKFLLFGFLCIITCSLQAQSQQCNAILPSGPEQAGSYFNPTHSGFKPDHLVVPAKRNMFNPSNSIWKWDTIHCYNTSSDDIPFQRITRTYNSFGEELTNLFERRQGSLAWENYARETFTYDSAGNKVGHLQEVSQNNTWMNFLKQEFAYNSNGDEVDWKREVWDSTYWSKMWHYSWNFNSNGLCDTSIYQEGQDSLWVNHWLWISDYDTNGNLTSVLTHTWINDIWEVTNLGTYTYDSNGNCQTYLKQNWENASWVNFEFYIYSWDTAGNRLSTLIQEWQNNAWVNLMFKSYVNDSLGNRIIDLTQLWLNPPWENSGRILYEYDESSNMLAKMSQTWDYSYWRNQNMQQYTFDSSGNSLTGKYQHWYINWQPYDGSLAVFADHEQDIVLSEIYRYTAEVDSVLVYIEPAQSQVQVTLFPNPAHSMVYVSRNGGIPDQNLSLTMFDLRGHLVLTKQIVSETTGIDVSSLKPGIYFVRFSDNRMSRVLKLVKE